MRISLRRCRMMRPPDDILKVEFGRLAQLGEHHVRNVGVVGSNPMPSTKSHPVLQIRYNSTINGQRTLNYYR